MLLVYTHKITPRLTYAFKHICKRILGIEVLFTSKIEDFIAHNDLKMSYTKQPLSNELFVKSHDLLFQQGLTDLEIHSQKWDNTKGFFVTNERSNLPYDIFAASFYLLSRYEEYLPSIKDEYGRFSATESLAYKFNFLQQPVIDIWAYKLKAVLKECFPQFQFPKKTYRVQPVIDVPVAFAYKQKGVLRNLGGTLTDALRFRIKKLYQRFSVVSGLKKDPHDTYKWFINKQKQYNFKFIVFFLIGDYSTYDKNININNKKFVSLIKSVADYCYVGLKTSFLALDNIDVLKKEKIKLESIVNRDLTAVRNSFSKLNLPETYRNLVDLEINQDYTMGYHDTMGFRAGTCTPFQFYDLDYEIQTPLQVNPYHCMDFTLLKHQSLLDKSEHLQKIINEVKKVNGVFVPVFHNYSFSDLKPWKGFRALFNQILDSTNG